MTAHRIPHVTGEGAYIGAWSVSYHDWTGGIFGERLPIGHKELNVTRRWDGGWDAKTRAGDHHRKVFPSMEAANAFALERGYLMVHYRKDYAIARHVHREFLRKRHRQVIAWIKRASSARAISNYIELAGRLVARELDNPLAKSHWAVGWYDAARNLRPELYK